MNQCKTIERDFGWNGTVCYLASVHIEQWESLQETCLSSVIRCNLEKEIWHNLWCQRVKLELKISLRRCCTPKIELQVAVTRYELQGIEKFQIEDSCLGRHDPLHPWQYWN